MTQAFLPTREYRCFIASFDDDDAVGIQARLGESRGEEIGTRYAPEDLPARACCNASGEENGCGAVNGSGCAACDLVQTVRDKTAVRQDPVNRIKAKRKRRAICAPGRAHLPDVMSKTIKNRLALHASLPIVLDLFRNLYRVKSGSFGEILAENAGSGVARSQPCRASFPFQHRLCT